MLPLDHPDANITIGNHIFERVNNFTYLGAQINNKGAITEEINRAYFANLKLLKSRLIKKQQNLNCTKP